MDNPGQRSGGSLRKRVACELEVDGCACKGIATELAPHEIFVQLAGGSPPRPGAEVVIRLHLHDDIVGGDGIELRAIVSRHESDHVADATPTRGIMARIVEAPAEYHSLFGEGPYEDTTEVEILVEVGQPDADLPIYRAGGRPLAPPADDVTLAPVSPGDADLPARPASADPVTDEAMRDADLPTSRDSSHGSADLPIQKTATGPVVPPKSAASADAAVVNEDEVAQERQPAGGRPTALRRARPANAIVVYDGDKLQDIYDLLQSLGARPERARLSGPTRFRGWDLPPKLLIADAQDAVSIDWPQNLIADDVVRIAVASSASAVLGKIMRAQGFHYLVRRPLHPRALEVLLRNALHRGADRRSQRRSPIGLDARLRMRGRHWPVGCTLLELSATGCRVVTRADIPLLSPVTIRIGRRVSGTRTISLRSRVVRRRQDESSGEWSMALRFLEVPAEQRGRLDNLLDRTAIGPTSALVDSPITHLRERLRILFGRDRDAEPSAAAVGPFADDAEASTASKPAPERRHVRRGAMEREVVALDTAHERVSAVLKGRDLSTMGMRVDPHPEFQVGRRVLMAFFDWVSRGTVEVVAEVVRDDGDRGLGLRFLYMDAESAACLEQLVAALPAVESLAPHRRPVMFARVLPAEEDAGAISLDAVGPGPMQEPSSEPPAEPAVAETGPVEESAPVALPTVMTFVEDTPEPPSPEPIEVDPPVGEPHPTAKPSLGEETSTTSSVARVQARQRARRRRRRRRHGS